MHSAYEYLIDYVDLLISFMILVKVHCIVKYTKLLVLSSFGMQITDESLMIYEIFRESDRRGHHENCSQDASLPAFNSSPWHSETPAQDGGH